MDGEKVIKSVQEQATAGIVNFANNVRVKDLLKNIDKQDMNFCEALQELRKLKEFCANPNNILGSMKTKHGEIAENMQVRISNARNLVKGLKAEYSIDVGKTAKEDYLHNGKMVQSKFTQNPKKTLEHIMAHKEKYEDYIQNEGSYDIPKDQYKKIKDIISKKPSELNRGEYNIFKKINELENNGIRLDKEINPSVIDYKDAQLANADKTISREKNNIKEINDQKVEEIFEKAKPSVKEGLKVAAGAALLEGAVAFALDYHKKRKEGKKITIEDIEDIGINVAKGSIRGGTVYLISNFTATPANVATSLVSAMFGVASQLNKYRRGDISKEDFAINSETMCLELSISAISALVGQAVIPIPALGALIGNSVGMVLNDIAKEICSDNEQKIIDEYCSEIIRLNTELEEKYKDVIKLFTDKFEQFSSIIELALDEEVNIAFDSSIELARFLGVEENKILKTKNEIDVYFLN